ncbi:MAG: hydrogenase 3 maturation endopeptidase HyCI [Anaerolineaceae bacterium]|jgi:Hydrogenase 3 maturation peptidase Hycl. Aspartic peptidase. MEROPS family A31|nr:hydrogenase maturation peptidase HycI [Anaerolineae bacterium]MCL4824940.1 hydrogenase maturation peptidase HycI [Anaerolineales bacterium]MDL1926685.1 hydrogenase maturation peptidase HycI [Anaerolineae bacterium AMX1]GIK08479.1 MAG: hydrogenase 3 maturation endopeptidase HyCI [Chloroflexota bacterium]GJQ38371.1 MAG: hydrogenase 3 maturation endopeptidase HyCI [Anaerolineaceae bacterium]
MNVLLAVGNGMMGDDGAGVLLAQMLRDAPLDGWRVTVGGSAPENVVHQIRAMDASRVLVVDAADMDLEPGAVRRIDADKLDDPFLMTTHTLPLTFLIESLCEFVPQVDLLGIQPNIVAFGFPMSEEVRRAVGQVYADLKNGRMDWCTCN